MSEGFMSSLVQPDAYSMIPPLGAANDLMNMPAAQDQNVIKEKCEEFEAILYNCMLKAMRRTVPVDGLFSGGYAEDMYRSMLDQEYATMLAGSTHTSIAEALYQKLSPADNGEAENRTQLSKSG